MTVRLTVAQALVRFLASQYTERDGVGSGSSPAASASSATATWPASARRCSRPADGRGGPAVPPGPQRAGDGARGGRLRPAAEPAGDLRRAPPRSAPARPTWSPAPRWPPSTGCRCCCCPRRLRHPGRQPGAAGAGGPALVRRLGQRRLPAGVAVLGPDQPARAAPVGAAGRDAGADRPGRDRRGDPGAPAGRAGRGLRLAGRAVRRAGLAVPPPGARAGRAAARRRAAP